MKLKNIKKVSAFALAFCMSLTAVAPIATAMVIADTTDVTTELVKSTGTGAAPVVQAKWEANINRYLDDDLTTAGAQFNPTGVKDTVKSIAICAVVSDEDGMDDISGVFADVYYPENIAVGEHHVKLDSQDGSSEAGCGVLMQEDTLTKLTTTASWALFCNPEGNSVYNKNHSLPTFANGYDYDTICAEDGTILKGALVYCAQKDISYEDPAGLYDVTIMAQDDSGLNGFLTNQFEYLPLTAFETDFTSINYGTVKLNTHKTIPGNLTFDPTDGLATVRNIGNTRLSMNVWQDDMELGTSSGIWNVEYDARVGSYASYATYSPEETTNLADILDLSETDEMDFSILIKKFPTEVENPDRVDYVGNMVLSATPECHLTCETSG